MSLRSLPVALVLLTGLAFPALAQSPLTLKRVLLSTGGVGYFEYEAEVEGDAELDLEVRLDQVDDVLKSIVVYDDLGGVGTIRLPGREPVEQAFRDLPFGRDALGSPVELLNALQGAEITVSGVRPLRGRILRALPEQTVTPEGQAMTRHRVTLLTAGGMRQFVLEETDGVVFADDALQRQVEQALTALSEHRARDRRRLRIESRGEGRRLVRVAYVVGAPLWKASYRLTLDADPKGGEGLLQGWAVLENLSGVDWRDVELTLASGNPVTFRQALYQAYYVQRPEVPVEVMGRVLPPLDTGVVAGAEVAQRELRRDNLRLEKESESFSDRAAAGPMAALARVRPLAPAQSAIAVATGEATTQVLFRFEQPITVASGNSLVVPIADRKVKAERLSLYQPATVAEHPLSSVRLSNDGDSGLPPGVMTLYEATAGGAVAYVGDARMGPLPAGEDRLLSFAVDNKTKVDREERHTTRIASGRISRGVLHLTRTERQRTVYRIAAPAREARRLVIEHPLVTDWRLIEPKEGSVERTGSHYRLTAELTPGEERELVVVLERPVSETIRLADLRPDWIESYIAARELSPAVRDAFRQFRDLKGALDAAREALSDLEKRQQAIAQDQSRIRDNLARVPRDSALYRRYLDKLAEQEDELERLLVESEAARERVRAAEARLTEYVESLDVG